MLYGLDWTGLVEEEIVVVRETVYVCVVNCVCTVSQVLGFEIYALSNCYMHSLYSCVRVLRVLTRFFVLKVPGLLCSHVLHSVYGPSPTYVLD